jgi:hypothetical protein
MRDVRVRPRHRAHTLGCTRLDPPWASQASGYRHNAHVRCAHTPACAPSGFCSTEGLPPALLRCHDFGRRGPKRSFVQRALRNHCGRVEAHSRRMSLRLMLKLLHVLMAIMAVGLGCRLVSTCAERASTAFTVPRGLKARAADPGLRRIPAWSPRAGAGGGRSVAGIRGGTSAGM